MERMKKISTNKGITLIALVITIIVLLILAGVTINLTLGENGIFKTAQQAAKNYTNAQNRELAGLDNFMNEITNTINGEYTGETGKTEVSGKYNATMKVNAPKVAGTGLKPVTINPTTGATTEVAETAGWYNYNTEETNGVAAKTWANAETKDGSLWVWIPRYAYKLDETNQTIDIVFLKDTGLEPATDTTADGVATNSITIKRASEIKEQVNSTNGTAGNYIVHPAFTNESSEGYPNGGWKAEIPGFWVAKFEAGFAGDTTGEGAKDSNVLYTSSDANYYGEVTANSTKIKYPIFQANRPSFNYITIGDSWKLCRQLTDSGNPYGFSTEDTHMMKNSEWGAVAYLSFSNYGRGKSTQVAVNKANAGETSTKYVVTGYGETSETDLSSLLAGASGNWTDSQGVLASTTGNINGVYDLSGGLWERTAGYLKNDSTTYGGDMIKSGESTITSSNEYVDVYTDYDNATDKKRLGEAIWETSTGASGFYGSWNGDWAGFVISGYPFPVRGGDYVGDPVAGVFTFSATTGGAISSYGFRTIIVP